MLSMCIQKTRICMSSISQLVECHSLCALYLYLFSIRYVVTDDMFTHWMVSIDYWLDEALTIQNLISHSLTTFLCPSLYCQCVYFIFIYFFVLFQSFGLTSFAVLYYAILIYSYIFMISSLCDQASRNCNDMKTGETRCNVNHWMITGTVKLCDSTQKMEW